MSTKNLFFDNYRFFPLSTYMKSQTVRVIYNDGSTIISPDANDGELLSIEPGPFAPQSTEGIKTVFKQTLHLKGSETLLDSQDAWKSFIYSKFAIGTSYSNYKCSFTIPDNEQITLLDDNDLFHNTHSFYQFRIRDYELVSSDGEERNFPCFLDGLYKKRFPTSLKARSLYDYNDQLSLNGLPLPFLMVRESQSKTNKNYHMFSNHMHKGGNHMFLAQGAYNMKKNYFYQYAKISPQSAQSIIDKKSNVFVLFDYNNLLNEYVLDVPFYNRISMERIHQGFNEVKDIFEDAEMVEIIMSMLKNSGTSTKSLLVNGSAASYSMIDVLDEILNYNSSNSLELEDELFLFDPDESIYDNDNKELTFLVRRIITIGRLRSLMGDFSKPFKKLFPDPTDCYREIIAHKIVKRRAGETIPIQTFYFYSFDKTKDFIDTQIRFDTTYEYEVSAFAFIAGQKIAFNNLRTTKDDGDFLVNQDGANTDEAVNLSDHRFQAKVDMVVKPSFQILSIPIFTKQLRVVEPPPIEPKVTFQDVSGVRNKIKISIEDVFDINISDNERKELITFSEEEEEHYMNLTRYCNSRMIYSSFVATDSVFEVYRMETEPTDITDFADKLIYIANSETLDVYGDRGVCSYMFDYLEHQKKYYYLFRTRTHYGNPSNPSPIYVVEKYQDADETFIKVETMTIEKDKNYSMEISLRRFMQVLINDQHFIFNNNEFVSNASANDNIGTMKLGDVFLEEPIWEFNNKDGQGNHIKLRLESKNTGKKIDLNLFFRYDQPKPKNTDF